ncbi:MAG TPA: hypothetical protein VKA49_12855 [Flavitalea sp.]|nr:hypothetical protein [Flavitalea sp.]
MPEISTGILRFLGFAAGIGKNTPDLSTRCSAIVGRKNADGFTTIIDP